MKLTLQEGAECVEVWCEPSTGEAKTLHVASTCGFNHTKISHRLESAGWYLQYGEQRTLFVLHPTLPLTTTYVRKGLKSARRQPQMNGLLAALPELLKQLPGVQ